MSKKQVIPVALLLMAAVSVLLYFNWGRESRDIIRLYGHIEATTADLGFQVGGRLQMLHVDEGQRVEAGRLLASLDPAELRDRQAAARARLSAAEAQVAQLETAVRLQRESTRSETARAEAVVQAAAHQLDELRNGSRPQEREQSRQALAAARSRLTNARQELERVRSLHDIGAVPTKSLDAAQSLHDVAAAEERRAAQALALIEEGPRAEIISAAEARLRQAEAQLEQARLGRLAVDRLTRQLDAVRAEVEHARAQLQLATTQLGYAELRSPSAGSVISKNAETGEVVNAGAPVFTVANLDEVWLRVFLNETDLGRVRLGQAVSVHTDTYPDRVYEGTIAFLSDQAEFTPKTIQTEKERVKLVYRMKVNIKNPNQELKPGMPADARIAL